MDMQSSRNSDSTRHVSNNGRKHILPDILNMIRRRQELAIVVALGTCAILSALFLFACVRTMIPVDGINNWAGERIGNDFIVFYSSALLSLAGEAASAYDQATLNAFQDNVLGIDPRNLPWRYPPIFFLFLLPFTYLSYLGAFWSWSVLTITMLMVVVRQITPVWYLPLLVPLCLPVAYSMVAGQNGNLTAILIGAGLVMLPRSARIAGIIFGLLAYKPQMAVVIPFCLLAGRYYSAFISMAITTIALILISWVAFGTEPWIAFLQGLSSQTDSAFGATREIWERMPSVIITALQVFDSSKAAWTLQVCVALLAITLSTWVWRTSTNPGARALALVASTPLISPYVWDYDMAILVIPIAFLANEAWENKWSAARFILLISMWVAEPTIRVMSGKIGLQLGLFFWAILLIYSAFIVKFEHASIVRQETSGS